MAVGHARLQIERSFKSFQATVAASERLLRSGNYDAAAVCAELATDSAIWHHPGLLYSPRLERVLAAIGNATTDEITPPGHAAPRSSPPRDVVHVLTNAMGIGGHTRFVWRWIQIDAGRRHSVVLTSQGGLEVPKELADAVSSTGGVVHVLDREAKGLVAKARALRHVAARTDVVLLQLNVEDVVPCIALSRKAGLPPIVFVTQNDVNFWVGVNISDLVVYLRESTRRLGATRRGIPTERTVPVPIPLQPVARSRSVAEAKERLGVPAETVVLLSIGRPAKYTTRFRPTFLEAVAPVIEEDEGTTLLVVGPGPHDEWAAAHQRSNGRIVATGVRTDTSLFYEAADIYLDAIPLASNTSLLEAGCYGLPLVSYFPYSRESEVLGADSPGFDRTILRASDVNNYREMLRSLIRDETLRSRWGARTQTEILEKHTGSGWKKHLDELYAKVGTTRVLSEATAGEDAMSLGELDLLLSRLYSAGDDVRWVNEGQLKLLPYSQRLLLCFELFRISARFSLSMLLPDGLARQLRKVRSPEPRNAS
jgi:glycosyltransferase involved in cell wall biosynthesis